MNQQIFFDLGNVVWFEDWIVYVSLMIDMHVDLVGNHFRVG